MSDILAVLLPCACGYAEIVTSQGLPEDRFYRDWIETYSSREFLDLSDGLIGKMNAHAGDETDHPKDRLFRLYKSSTRFEFLFFDMSWKKEEWLKGLNV